MILQEKLMKALIKGKYESYVKQSSSYNPYSKSVLYDWEFKLPIDDLLYIDYFRGFNPYSGVEYIYEKENDIPIWSCDYVGYVKQDIDVSAEEIYNFLKESRGSHLLHCDNNLFSNYKYENNTFQYETYFQGDITSLLQIENFYYNNLLIAQQMSSGRLKQQSTD